VKKHRRLRERLQPAFEHGERHARFGVEMDDATDFRPRRMHGAVDGQAGGIDGIGRLADDRAVLIDLHEVGCGYLLEGEAEGIDKEVMVGPGHARRYVIVDELVPAFALRQAIAGGELDPCLAFRFAHRRIAEAARAHRDVFLHGFLLAKA